jgi:ABC-type glycerol-3-phosphate transport system permease component
MKFESPILIMVVVLIVLIFYIPFILMIMKQLRAKDGRKDFYNAVLSIIDREQDNQKAVEQINIIFKKLSELNTQIASRYKNSADLCEDLLCRSESYGSTRFKNAYSLEFDNEKINRIIEIISILRSRQPFSSVSSKHGNLLNMIKHAFDTDNKDLASNNLIQLANDIEILESTIEIQDKRNQISMVISIVGVILTLVFGALSVIPLLSTSSN